MKKFSRSVWFIIAVIVSLFVAARYWSLDSYPTTVTNYSAGDENQKTQAAPPLTPAPLQASAEGGLSEAAEPEVLSPPDRPLQHCVPGLSGSRETSEGGVECGCDYDGTRASFNGYWVCAGGKYNGSISSFKGTDVACGGEYNGTAASFDGYRVCAGGRYNGSISSFKGTHVACGGEYDGTASSFDGKNVCAGGRYNGSIESFHGNDVACGGEYNGSRTSFDGTDRCYGGRYR